MFTHERGEEDGLDGKVVFVVPEKLEQLRDGFQMAVRVARFLAEPLPITDAISRLKFICVVIADKTCVAIRNAWHNIHMERVGIIEANTPSFSANFRGKSVVLLEARVNVIDVLPRFFASIARHEHEQVYVILSGFNRFDERVQGIRTLSLCLLIEREVLTQKFAHCRGALIQQVTLMWTDSHLGGKELLEISGERFHGFLSGGPPVPGEKHRRA